MTAPPWIIVCAASGTTSTFMPSCVSSCFSAAIAVDLPAHGPPVTKIRKMLKPAGLESLRWLAGGFRIVLEYCWWM